MILISYPNVSCYNNSHIDTHNYSHTHHTHITCGTAQNCSLKLPTHSAY